MRFARASILLSAALGLAILTGCTASPMLTTKASSLLHHLRVKQVFTFFVMMNLLALVCTRTFTSMACA